MSGVNFSDNNSICPSIDDFRNKIYSTVYSLITVFGFVGNGFALYVLIKTFRKTSTFHIYMMNLAISDLLCCLTLPLRVVYYVNKGHWYFGDFLCRISSYALYVNLYCSIFFMMAMSCTRFIAIVFPVQNLKLVSERKAKIICACIWIFICATSSPFLMSGTKEVGNKTKCFEPPSGTDTRKLVILNYISLVVGFSIPFLVILICYTGMIWTLMVNSGSMKKQKSMQTKAIRMICIVMAAFLISFMPYHIQRTLHLHFLMKKGSSCDDIVYMQKSVVITLCLAAGNSCFDPMLYFFSGDNFRRRLSSFRKPSVSTNLTEKKKKKKKKKTCTVNKINVESHKREEESLRGIDDKVVSASG